MPIVHLGASQLEVERQVIFGKRLIALVVLDTKVVAQATRHMAAKLVGLYQMTWA